MASVRVRQVHKTFGGTRIVHGAGVAIADGEFVVLVGPSRCLSGHPGACRVSQVLLGTIRLRQIQAGLRYLDCKDSAVADITEAEIRLSGCIRSRTPLLQESH